MTIKETQELIEVWTGKNPASGNRSDLSLMASLTEEVGELVRAVAHRHDGGGSPQAALEEELGDILWVVLSLANQTGVDLTEALIRNLDKKTERSF